ncbi:hypothetical protein [Thermococcus sp.]|uniref:hypothetical protein n=1 Tax=Thermococcus sp. TaxID=35749 RepID=UPI0026323727|nr:hypothetical protein [Thermococcus sp.]
MILEYYLLLCSNPPELRPKVSLNFPWFEEVFLPALRGFAEKTNFMAFYSSHRVDYTEDLKIYRGGPKAPSSGQFYDQLLGPFGCEVPL